MNYVVLDMEWNQPFRSKGLIKTPIVLHGEIVQIGAVKLDENYHMLDTFNIMVLPKYYKKMHRKVSELTKITTEELQYGFPFRIAMKHFKKWCGEDFVFLTWGQDDIAMLRDNMVLHKLKTEWIPNTYNVQIIFADQIAKEQRQISLSNAMKRIGESALKAHDALHDARNTATVCAHLDMDKGLKEYETLQTQFFKTPVLEKRDIEKVFYTKDEALNDPKICNFYYSVLDENVVCTDFVRQNSEKVISIGKSQSGVEVFVRFKFVRQADGMYRVVRKSYELNEEYYNYYLKKKQRAEERRELYERANADPLMNFQEQVAFNQNEDVQEETLQYE